MSNKPTSLSVMGGVEIDPLPTIGNDFIGRRKVRAEFQVIFDDVRDEAVMEGKKFEDALKEKLAKAFEAGLDLAIKKFKSDWAIIEKVARK
jgi:hypothetical protein